jgi:hypothetical protein
MPRFQTLPAAHSHCAEILCRGRGDQLEGILSIGLDPYRELVEAFDQTPYPTAWRIDDELGAIGGVAGPPGICPVGVGWLVVAEKATRFSCALAREVKRQFTASLEIYPLVIAPLVPNDKRSIRFARFLGFRVELAYRDTNGLLYAVSGKQQKSNVLEAA